jgi:hypothetical protein
MEQNPLNQAATITIQRGVGGAYIDAVAEGLDGGEDVDGDAEQCGGRHDDAEAAADDEERVGSGAAQRTRRAGLRGGGGPGRRRHVRHGASPAR